jgi:hypothetical protein
MTETLDYVPGRFKVVRHIREKLPRLRHRGRGAGASSASMRLGAALSMAVA